MIRRPLFALAVAATPLGVVPALTARAAEPPSSEPADKSAYTIFDPTPTPLLRDLEPDRPGFTESPFTVDAGHVQIESSLVEWVKGDGETWSFLPTNVKVGLTNQVDLQLVVQPYLRQRVDGHTDSGHGDTQIRVKVNAWGNDGGDGFFGQTALAVIPYVQLPTGADAFSNDDHVEGGVLVPFGFDLPADFRMTVMAELDFLRDGTGGYDTFFAHSVVVDHPLVGDLSGYVEYAGIAPLGGSEPYLATLDAGLTYDLGDNVQLDCGVEIGLTSSADDLRLFAGVVYRL